MRVLANPIRLDGERLPNRAAPLLGADTDAILGEAGYDAAEIAGCAPTAWSEWASCRASPSSTCRSSCRAR